MRARSSARWLFSLSRSAIFSRSSGRDSRAATWASKRYLAIVSAGQPPCAGRQQTTLLIVGGINCEANCDKQVPTRIQAPSYRAAQAGPDWKVAQRFAFASAQSPAGRHWQSAAAQRATRHASSPPSGGAVRPSTRGGGAAAAQA